MVIIIMGVSGAGKSLVGTLLAEQLGWLFYEGDDFHPPANVQKMAAGIPLDDSDRAPWLAALMRLICELHEKEKSAVVTCSALKKVYRRKLMECAGNVHLVYLKGTYELILSRMRHRRGHFMPAELLKSQFDTLEEPEEALTVDVSQKPEAIVAEIRRGFRV